MNLIVLPRYVLVLLIFLLLATSVVVGVLLVGTDVVGEPERIESENLEVNENCLEKDPSNISWQNVKSIDKIEKNISSDIIATIKEYDENNEWKGSCKFYLTEYIEGALGISNLEIGSVTNIVYISYGKIAYKYNDAIFVQKIEEEAKAVVVVDQRLASETSLEDAGEQLIFGGPFLIDEGEWPGISTHGRFLFTVNFSYSCENPYSPDSCNEMIPLSNELKEKGVLGLWLYKDSEEGERFLLSSEVK